MWQGFPKNRLFRKKYDENRYFVAKLSPFGAIFGCFCILKGQMIPPKRVEYNPQKGQFFRQKRQWAYHLIWLFSTLGAGRRVARKSREFYEKRGCPTSHWTP